MTSSIVIARSESTLHIQINRPAKKNALTHDMYEAMAEAITKAETDMLIGCIVITGCQGNFTAGNDLKDFQARPPKDETAPAFQFILSLAKSTVPIIAAVDGVAIGIGVTMLLHCDKVFVSKEAYLQLPFVDLGLTPEAGSSYLLPKIMGHALASELLIGAKSFTGARAVELGIANEICEGDALKATAMAYAKEIAAKPPRAIRASKALMKSDREMVVAQIRKEVTEFIDRLQSGECAEALAAFLEKRPADFTKCKD